MILNTILLLLKTQFIMLYNILFEFIFGKTDTQNTLKHISDLIKVKYSGEKPKNSDIKKLVKSSLFDDVLWDLIE